MIFMLFWTFQRTRLALRLHHPSFRDFLLDEKRCGDIHFKVDEKKIHGALAMRCIRLMATSLRRDICDLDTHGVLVTDVKSSRVKQKILPELQYACVYWVQHLQWSDAQLYDDNQVHHFLQEHLLHWLEALSWMQKISEGILAVASLESIIAVSHLPNIKGT
jgi:hypothetical protein